MFMFLDHFSHLLQSPTHTNDPLLRKHLLVPFDLDLDRLTREYSRVPLLHGIDDLLLLEN